MDKKKTSRKPLPESSEVTALRKRTPYMQPDDAPDRMPTGEDGGDLSSFSKKPVRGRNVYIGADSEAGAGRGKGYAKGGSVRGYGAATKGRGKAC